MSESVCTLNDVGLGGGAQKSPHLHNPIFFQKKSAQHHFVQHAVVTSPKPVLNEISIYDDLDITELP
jgi:hypothetical protein